MLDSSSTINVSQTQKSLGDELPPAVVSTVVH